MKIKKFTPKGLTLIELLIVISLTALILLTLLSLYTTSQKYFVTESARADVIRDSRQVLLWISRDIKEACQVITSWDIYTSSNDCLILRVPSVDASGLIIDIESQFDYIIYRLNPSFPNRLERIIDANDGVSAKVDGGRVLVTRVNFFLLSSEGVEFSSIADFSSVSSVDISLTASQDRYGRTFQDTLNTVVKLRNKSV